MQSAIDTFRKYETAGMDLTLLVGPNWIINSDSDPLRTIQPRLGGTITLD